jgi:hypothetical protein
MRKKTTLGRRKRAAMSMRRNTKNMNTARKVKNFDDTNNHERDYVKSQLTFLCISFL